MKYWKLAFLVLGILPLTFATSILSFYFHAGQILGRLPSYNTPDPKDLEIYSDYSPIIDLLGQIWAYSFIVWIIVSIVYMIIKRNKINFKPIIISAIGQIIVLIIFFSEIIKWYAD